MPCSSPGHTGLPYYITLMWERSQKSNISSCIQGDRKVSPRWYYVYNICFMDHSIYRYSFLPCYRVSEFLCSSTLFTYSCIMVVFFFFVETVSIMITSTMLLLKQRVLLMEFVFKNGDKCTESVKQEFRNPFLDTREPHHDTVWNLVSKFHETGSVQDAPRSGRPSILSQEKVDEISDPTTAKSKKKTLRKFPNKLDWATAQLIKLLRMNWSCFLTKFQPYSNWNM
jgi:transposase